MRRGSSWSVVFRGTDADRPFLTGNEAMWHVFSPELRRRLADLQGEGTSYQAVLTRTREDLARHHLATRDLRASEIAYLLGYEDTSSFSRAFRGWTGTSPEVHRTTTCAVVGSG